MRKFYLFILIQFALASHFVLSNIRCSNPDAGKIPITTSSEKARGYYQNGQSLEDQYKFTEAEDFFHKAVAEDSSFASAYLKLYFYTANFSEANEHLNRALELADGVSEGEGLSIYASDNFRAGNNSKAMELYAQAADLYPGDYRIHALLGSLYRGQQEYEKSIEYCQKAMKISPNYGESYNTVGYTLAALERFDEAKDAFEKYIELAPNLANSYDSYASLLLAMGDYDESINQYQKALILDPYFRPSHIGIATNLNFKNEHENARGQLQKLFDMAQNDEDKKQALYAMAVSYVDEGNMDQGIAMLKENIAISQKQGDLLSAAMRSLDIGSILFQSGQYGQAKDHWNALFAQLNQASLPAERQSMIKVGELMTGAQIAMKEHNFASAWKLATECLAKSEEMENAGLVKTARLVQGLVALEQGDNQRAAAEFEQADKQNPLVLYNLALAYNAMHNVERAKMLFEKTANLNSYSNLEYSYVRHKAQDMLASFQD